LTRTLVAGFNAPIDIALPMRIAISGLRDARQLINSDSVLRVTPKRRAASVTVRFNGSSTSCFNTRPGCVGFLFVDMTRPRLILTTHNQFPLGLDGLYHCVRIVFEDHQ